MHFFGVRTSGSSALRLFPDWAKALGIEGARIEGIDIDLDSAPEVYRSKVLEVKRNPELRGALVTSHKLDVISAASDLFDYRSDPSVICSEVSCIYKNGTDLSAHAPDAECALRIQNMMLGDDYWGRHPEAELILLGSGGASAALVLAQSLSPNVSPRKIKAVDINQSRLDHLREVSHKIGLNSILECTLSDNAEQNCNLVAGSAPRSLIVNATGMGKDLPGSPLTRETRFPKNAIAWELNYRGPRLFMQQAEEAGVRVEDGWDLFVMNWFVVISTIWGLEISDDRFRDFKDASKTLKS